MLIIRKGWRTARFVITLSRELEAAEAGSSAEGGSSARAELREREAGQSRFRAPRRIGPRRAVLQGMAARLVQAWHVRRSTLLDVLGARRARAHPSLDVQVVHNACGRHRNPGFLRAFSTRPRRSGRIRRAPALKQEHSAGDISDTISSQPAAHEHAVRAGPCHASPMGAAGGRRELHGERRPARRREHDSCVFRLAPVAEARVAQPLRGGHSAPPVEPRGVIGRRCS